MLYAAGEGAYGVERNRIPARPTLLGRIKLLPRLPLFASVEQVEAFIAGTDSIAYKPDIVVLDTLATALAGEDENSSMAAAHLTDNGACGAIKNSWPGCTVVVIGHEGKDSGKGLRGTSAFEGNVDFLVQVKADKDTRTIQATAKKMRDAEEGYTAYFSYEAGGVPVPINITEREYRGLNDRKSSEETTPVGLLVQSYLRIHSHTDWSKGLETPALAHCLAEQEMGARPDDVQAQADWDTAKEKWRRSLLNARSKSWAKKSTDQRVMAGGEDFILRWFAPPEQAETEL